MKINMNWIQAAQEALLESKIVQTNENIELIYPHAFKGYISSLAASIVQSGLVPALSIYEKDNKGANKSADNNRALLVSALVITLNKRDKLKNKVYPFSDYIARLSTNATYKLQQDINQALIALKLALRIFKSDKKIKCNHSVEIQSTFSSLEKITIDNNFNYNPLQNTTANIGWLFYKDLYRSYKKFQYQKYNEQNKLVDITEEHQNKIIQQKICSLLETTFTGNNLQTNQRVINSLSKLNNYETFNLKTTYPGLLIGSGLSHGVTSEADIKVGLQFDYTTGLPYIPGSSIKGVLRSVFPNTNLSKEDNESRIEYLRIKLKEITGKEWKNEDISSLRKKLFEEGENSSLRDIFFDALIVGTSSKDKLFLGNDYITPHKNPFDDPTPIQFIKVLPDVEFRFSFQLNANIPELKPKERILLYKKILLDWGVGAKVNLGYGDLVEIP